MQLYIYNDVKLHNHVMVYVCVFDGITHPLNDHTSNITTRMTNTLQCIRSKSH